MQQSVKAFCLAVKAKLEDKRLDYFSHELVLDVGSHDINGNNRYLFDETCVYLGLDVCPGDNVDIVMPVHELYLAGNPFGGIISTEAFEHDMYITDSLPRICNILLQL